MVLVFADMWMTDWIDFCFVLLLIRDWIWEVALQPYFVGIILFLQVTLLDLAYSYKKYFIFFIPILSKVNLRIEFIVMVSD